LTYRVDNTDACGSSSISYTQKRKDQIWFFLEQLLHPAVTWLPTTNLFTDASGTIAYTGTNLATVYARPAADVIYTAKATAASGCSNTATANLIVVYHKYLERFCLVDRISSSQYRQVSFCRYLPSRDWSQCRYCCARVRFGGATVTIKPGRTLTIVNDVKVNGTLIFEDRASLVQINDGAVNLEIYIQTSNYSDQ
jgi:hypothetical protein